MCYTSSCDCCRDQGQEQIYQQWLCHSSLEISSGRASAETTLQSFYKGKAVAIPSVPRA